MSNITALPRRRTLAARGALRRWARGWRLQPPLTRLQPGERIVRLAAGETVLRDAELGHLEDLVIRATLAGVLAARNGAPPDGGHPAPAPRHLTAVPR